MEKENKLENLKFEELNKYEILYIEGGGLMSQIGGAIA